jgi:hypothetical protein
MLRWVYLPLVVNGRAGANGNWELIMMDAATGIAVFLGDRAAFNHAVAIWRGRVPAYIYLASDGPTPKSPPNGSPKSGPALVSYWQGQSKFVDGLAQETCRDFGHTGWGLDAAAHVAATGWVQGIDLYAEVRTRLTAALEFHAQYDLGTTAPSWLCGGSPKTGLGPVLEIAYNHYHRLGATLPKTGQLLQKSRPVGADYFIAWETLTNADNPDV